MNLLGIIGLIIGLIDLSLLIYKKVNALLAAIAGTIVVALFNSLEIWTSLTYLTEGIGSTLATYLPVFFCATLYGKLMSDTGCANAIAEFFAKIFGNNSAVLVITLTTALLVYGGVSAMVVAFTVFPIGITMLRKSDVPKKFLPAIIALGQSTFALTALPGTPQLNNIIPTTYLGTTSTAAPLLGIIASIIMFGLGYGYLQYEIKKAKKAGEGFDETSIKPGTLSSLEVGQTPSTILAFLPIILLIILYITFENVSFGSYQLGDYYTYAPVCTAMVVSMIYLIILQYCKQGSQALKKTISEGSGNWVGSLINFSIVVGFGTVIKNTAGYASLIDLVTGLDMNPYLSAALSVTLLAGVTGSASGGISIALSSEKLVASWTSQLTTQSQIGALHRIISVSSCGLDSLPHCGGILTTLSICDETHQSSYKYTFVVTVVFTLVAAAVLVILASLGLTM